MKALITLALIVGLYLLGKSIHDQYKAKRAQEALAANPPSGPADGLAGMPPEYEPSLQAAQAQGAAALKQWLDRFRPYLRDPKLAAIELDYVVLVSRSNPTEAKRAFQSVQRRIPPSSPLAERVKRLQATYGN